MSASWRWRTSGVPTWGGRPSTAFMPLLTWFTITWQSYKAGLSGQPGTQAIPAPNNDIPRDRLFVGDGQAAARDFGGNWYPSEYWQDIGPALGLGHFYPAGGNDCGVSIFSDNQLPVPAIEPMRGTRRLGQGGVVPVYMQPRPRAVTRRTVQIPNA